MDYKIEKKKNKNVHKYKREELDISIAFAKEAHKEFKEFLKGVILFGSAARRLNKTPEERAKDDGKGDIDLLLVLDDLTINITPELVETYKIIAEKMVAKISKRIHVTTLKFSSFWDYVRNGDPVGINILRDGVALIDTGFFDPLQALLYQGKIRPTYESVWTYFNKAPLTLNNSRWHLVQASIDLYWAVIDSAHAALMKLGCIPPTPEHVADLMEIKMVKTKLCDKKFVKIMKFFYKQYKEISHRQLNDISGFEYEKNYTQAKLFVSKMKDIIEHLE